MIVPIIDFERPFLANLTTSFSTSSGDNSTQTGFSSLAGRVEPLFPFFLECIRAIIIISQEKTNLSYFNIIFNELSKIKFLDFNAKKVKFYKILLDQLVWIINYL